jgi:DNA end-binding protein Ku
LAPRAYWKGYLRLSLVSVPVQLYSAVESGNDLPLHQIHRPSGERVRYEKVVPGVGPVESEDIALGYEYEAGRHVLLEDEELREVAPESSDTIELEQFIGRDELDDIYVERPFFVVPAGKVGDEGYRVLRSALKRTGRIAVGEMVLHRRERIVAVRPCGRGLMLETLRYPEDLRDADRYFGAIADGEPDPAQVQLACELIERQKTPFRPEQFKDDYEAGLRALVEAKVRGRRRVDHRPAALPAPPQPSEVIDLVQALRRSLDELTRATANRNEPALTRERRA